MGTDEINESNSSTLTAEETPVFPFAASQTPEKPYESTPSQSASSSNSDMSLYALEIQTAIEAQHGALTADDRCEVVMNRPLSYEGREHYATARGETGVPMIEDEDRHSETSTETVTTFDGIESAIAAMEREMLISRQADSLRRKAKKHRLQMRLAYEVAADNQLKLMRVTGLGWFKYDRNRWVEDIGDKAATNAVMKTIRRLAADAMSDRDLHSDLVKAQTASGARGVLTLTASLPGIAVQASELDADPYVLNTPTGSLDLKTFELRPHDPADCLTKITRGAHDKSACSVRWEAFLERILPDAEVRAYVQRVFGLSLVGKQLEHILLVAIGTGRNGKGVAYESVGYSFGDYTHFAPSTLFEQTKANVNGASPALFDLRGARFVALSETEKTARIASSLLKSLTGGDPVTARKLYGDPVTFLPSWLILLVTNHLPTFPANDPAVFERVRVVPFDVYIPEGDRDRQLTAKLEEEADGILTWAAQGLADYWEGGLCEPDAVKLATSNYAADQDNVSRFMEVMCTDAPVHGGSTTKELHDAYAEWAIAEGIFREHRLGRTDFGRALDKLGFAAVKKSRGMVREGLELEASGSVVMIASPAGPDTSTSAPATDTSISSTASSGVVPVASSNPNPNLWDGFEAEPADQTWVG
ncbi:DNA primase family protein [Arthrobacter alpinus]|uniref:DNA primase family protein n=1 Tax=Arthrobacter alpinus TaxID=656366 RepID=UPI0007835679|nr:phage/plasmid primase, P4 family [Arthrobacter alpinus]